MVVAVDERVQQFVSHTGGGLPSSDTAGGGGACYIIYLLITYINQQ